jgi:Na+/melibiose symporter-like transporter
VKLSGADAGADSAARAVRSGQEPIDRSLTRTGILGYVAYAIPLTGLSAAIVNLVPAYYAEVLGLSLGSVGAVFFLLRIFDAVTDPAMGWLLDRHPFRQQHKPWLILSLPVFLGAIWLLFFPIQGWVGIPYLLGAGFLAYSAYTVGLVTHQAWGAALAREPGSLSTLMGYRELAVIGGILGVFLAPAVAEGLGFEGLPAKITASTLFLVSCFVIFTPASLFFAPDQPEKVKSRPVDWGTAKSFVFEREFILVSIANLATSFSMVALSVVSYFVATYVFDSSNQYGLGMTAYFVAAGAGMALWMSVAQRIGDRAAFLVSVAYVVFILALTPVMSTFEFDGRYPLFTSILGIGFGAAPFLIRSMIGSIANEHELRTGQAVRGTAYAVTTFFDKLGSGLAAGIVLPLVGWLGFDPVAGGGVVGERVLLWMATLAPIIGFGVALIAISFVRRSRG